MSGIHFASYRIRSHTVENLGIGVLWMKQSAGTKKRQEQNLLLEEHQPAILNLSRHLLHTLYKLRLQLHRCITT